MILAYEDGDAFTENLMIRLKDVPLTRMEIAFFHGFVNGPEKVTARYCADWLETVNSKRTEEAVA